MDQIDAMSGPIEEKVVEKATFGNTIDSMKRGLGIDGKGLDAVAQKLLEIINANPTHAVVGLSRHGWVLTTQQELDDERAANRAKLAAAGKGKSNAAALKIAEAIETLIQIHLDEEPVSGLGTEAEIAAAMSPLAVLLTKLKSLL